MPYIEPGGYSAATSAAIEAATDNDNHDIRDNRDASVFASNNDRDNDGHWGNNNANAPDQPCVSRSCLCYAGGLFSTFFDCFEFGIVDAMRFGWPAWEVVGPVGTY